MIAPVYRKSNGGADDGHVGTDRWVYMREAKGLRNQSIKKRVREESDRVIAEVLVRVNFFPLEKWGHLTGAATSFFGSEDSDSTQLKWGMSQVGKPRDDHHSFVNHAEWIH